MIPGPVEVSTAVLDELSGPIRAHYGAEWTATYNETLSLLQQVMQTTHPVFLMPGSGNTGNDAALGSMVREGDTAIVGANGMFGDRLVEIARAYGAAVVVVHADAGAPLRPDDFAEALRQHPQATLVALVHLETSTGVLNQASEIAAVAHAVGVPVILDAVSSLGGTALPVDAWGIDVCTSASQKCLSAPAGLALVAVAPGVWRQIERPRARGWYNNLNVWRHYSIEWGDWHPQPGTMPVNTVLALRQGLRELMAEGVETRLARYRRLAERLRRGLIGLGMPPVVADEFAAPVLTAVWVPEGVTASEVVEHVLGRGIQIARGFGALRERVCRIGHMGSQVDDALIDALLAALEEFVASR
jgi:alanine-glyoxylate transaminase/serine-glyoxylate transaminase/serine-pyruvate transaminase